MRRKLSRKAQKEEAKKQKDAVVVPISKPDNSKKIIASVPKKVQQVMRDLAKDLPEIAISKGKSIGVKGHTLKMSLLYLEGCKELDDDGKEKGDAGGGAKIVEYCQQMRDFQISDQIIAKDLA